MAIHTGSLYCTRANGEREFAAPLRFANLKAFNETFTNVKEGLTRHPSTSDRRLALFTFDFSAEDGDIFDVSEKDKDLDIFFVPAGKNWTGESFTPFNSLKVTLDPSNKVAVVEDKLTEFTLKTESSESLVFLAEALRSSRSTTASKLLKLGFKESPKEVTE